MNNRSTALDALRGLAITGMVFSGSIAQTLPAWMYHAQVGPRSGFKYDPTISGITWVDLVFPFFLFALGAAVPLALNRKLQQGLKPLTFITSIVKRFLLLCFFSIAIYHTTPFRVNSDWNFIQAVLAFVLMFAAFVKIPTLSKNFNLIINTFGIVLLSGLIFLNIRLHPGVFSEGFSLSHNDIIILILANMALFGSFIWLLTRNKLLPRIGIMALLLAFRLSGVVEGNWLLFNTDFLNYLFIVIPGTIVGDLLAKGLSQQNHQNSLTQRERIKAILLLKPNDSLSELIVILLKWGFFWLLLGSLFIPFDGGIKKDPATMSYFFITSGLAIFTLLLFILIADFFGKSGYLRYLAACGQNPMVAYVAGTFLVLPLLVFTGLNDVLNSLPETAAWLGIVKGLVITGGMMVITILTVRLKWFWKT